MKTEWKKRDVRERGESKGNRTKRERVREKDCRREREAGELCSVVTGAESENSNLVITAHCCLHGREGGGLEMERDGTSTAGEIPVC